MNMKQRLDEFKTGKVKKAMPVLSFPGVQLLNITVKELINDSTLQANCMKAIADRYSTLASVSLMDLSVEAECFGSAVRFSDDEVPTVTGSIISSPDEAEALAVPAIGSGRTSIYIEAVKKASGMITDRPVLAGVIGPFSLAGRLLDMTEIMIACMDEPDMVHTVLAKAAGFIGQYISAFKNAGANGVVIAEPAAGLLSPTLNAEFSVPYVKAIVEKSGANDFAVVYHNCGPYTTRQINDILTIGADIYHFGDAIDLNEMKTLIPSDVLFSGNISPANCFRNGTPSQTADTTRKLLENCGSLPNYIPSSGCDIPPMSKLESIDAFFAEVERFYISGVQG